MIFKRDYLQILFFFCFILLLSMWKKQWVGLFLLATNTWITVEFCRFFFSSSLNESGIMNNAKETLQYICFCIKHGMMNLFIYHQFTIKRKRKIFELHSFLWNASERKTYGVVYLNRLRNGKIMHAQVLKEKRLLSVIVCIRNKHKRIIKISISFFFVVVRLC